MNTMDHVMSYRNISTWPAARIFRQRIPRNYPSRKLPLDTCQCRVRRAQGRSKASVASAVSDCRRKATRIFGLELKRKRLAAKPDSDSVPRRDIAGGCVRNWSIKTGRESKASPRKLPRRDIAGERQPKPKSARARRSCCRAASRDTFERDFRS